MELRKIKNEPEIWSFIYKRRKKERTENDITKEKWKNHFEKLLGEEEGDLGKDEYKEKKRKRRMKKVKKKGKRM